MSSDSPESSVIPEPSRSPDLPDPTFPAGYERSAEFWEGGMGIVFRARETDLQRDVAVKLLRDRFTAAGPHAQRFREEAHITAQLQHPNIPPVHRVGKLPNGRPFLVMKLIKGDTLKKLLETRANLDADRGRFLLAFEAIAQAVAYAHERKVIHRDLKPDNVMVGAFGEVQVMDWGLAKVLRSSEAELVLAPSDDSYTIINSLRPSDVVSDGAMGTVPFMAPEQALGDIAAIGSPTDVFLLGGILCVILTGHPPYMGRNLLGGAAAWKIEDAFSRFDTCGADAELIALAKRCLAKEPCDRYANAGEVAKAVAGWRVATADRARKAAIEEAAKRAAEAAKRMYLVALEGFNQLVFGVQVKLSRRSGTLDIQKQVLSVARAGLEQLVGEVEKHGTPARTLIWTLFKIGDVELLQGNTTAALREWEAVRELAQRLAESDPSDLEAQRDLSVSFDKLGDVVLKLGQVGPAREWYEKALEVSQRLAESDPSHQAQRGLSVSFNKLGDVVLKLGRAEEARSFYEQGKDIRQRLAAADPSNSQAQRDLLLSHLRLGEVERKMRNYAQAIEFYTRALAIAQWSAHLGDFAEVVKFLESRLIECWQKQADADS